MPFLIFDLMCTDAIVDGVCFFFFFFFNMAIFFFFFFQITMSCLQMILTSQKLGLQTATLKSVLSHREGPLFSFIVVISDTLFLLPERTV